MSNFNPFGTSGVVDYNADLSAAESARENARQASIASFMSANGMIVRVMGNKTQSRLDPTKETTNASYSFRVTTHLYNTIADVDRFINLLVTGMRATV